MGRAEAIMRNTAITLGDITPRCMVRLAVAIVGVLGLVARGDLLPTRVELAPLKVGEMWQHALVITNSGAEALTVTGVVSSCECLQATGTTNPIPPGGQGEVAVVLTPTAIGELAYDVTVQTTTGEWRWSLLVTVTAGPPMRVAEAYADLAALRQGKADGKTYTLVDVRSPEAYAVAHIPDSLNIARAAVKTKAFLRDTPVVLVDGGWGDPMLEDEWQRLRAAGFAEVRILQGGVAIWRAAGGHLEGTADGAEISRLTGYEALTARAYPDWIVVQADTVEVARLDNVLLGHLRIPFSATNQGVFVRAVTSHLGRIGPTARLMVMTSNGQGYEAIERALRGQVDVPVFFVEYGLLGLQRAHDVQVMSAGGGTTNRATGQSATTGPGGPKPCGTCPGKRRP